MTDESSFTQRFTTYFTREVAENAAKSISDGSEIQFHVKDTDGKLLESFVFTKETGKNRILPGPARDPQLIFNLTRASAESILQENAQDVGSIGIGIAKLIVSSDPALRIHVQFKAGFLSLFTKGYFGVLSTGGGQFASFLAARGLSGMSAIKALLKKTKE